MSIQAKGISDESPHRKVVRAKLAKLDEQLKVDGFWPFPNLEMFESIQASRDTTSYYGLEQWSFDWRNDKGSAAINYYPSYKTVRLLIIRPAASEIETPYYDRSLEPTWHRNEAEQKALPYAKIMGPENLGGYKPWAASWRYGRKDWKTGKYGNGYWEVLFRRHTKTGIPYNEDVIQVELFEKAGPGIIVVDCFTWYDEDQPIKAIPEAEAEKAALVYAVKFAPTMNLPLPEKTRQQKLGLSIVVPNTVKRRDLNETERRDSKRLAGRPAYVFVYWINEQRFYSVYIDAETGKRIGGSY